MSDEPLFDFAVPDDLLREAVAQVRDPEVVADLAVMPGTGQGKPPPLIGILRSSGYAPLVLMTAAALVPGTLNNGITLIGHNLQLSFHMSNASLGAVAFVAQVSQLLWAVPLALWADRGSRKVVAAVALLIFSVFGAVMALSPNVWAFAFLYLAASVGSGVNNTVHNSYLADAYPTEGRGRIFSWHQLSDPISQTVGILIFGYVVTVAHNWRYGMLIALVGIPLGFALFTLREPDKGANESSHILKASGMDLQSQQETAPGSCSARRSPASCGSDRSTTSWWPWPSSASPAPARRSSATSSSSTSSTSRRPAGARCTPSSGWPPS